MKRNTEDEISVAEACAIIGIAVKTFYNWRALNPPKGPVARVRWNGGKKELRLRRSEVEAWKKANFEWEDEAPRCRDIVGGEV